MYDSWNPVKLGFKFEMTNLSANYVGYIALIPQLCAVKQSNNKYMVIAVKKLNSTLLPIVFPPTAGRLCIIV